MSRDMTEEEFLDLVQRYVEAHPTITPRVTDYVARGISGALNRCRSRALDMEIALSHTLRSASPKKKALALEQLRKWKGETALRWKELEGKPS